jgi:hypothetical protein
MKRLLVQAAKRAAPPMNRALARFGVQLVRSPCTRRHSVDLSDIEPIYHDFSLLGAYQAETARGHMQNQRSKAPILQAYVQYALAKTRDETGAAASFLELFCADGYYTMYARHLGAARAIGVDNDRDGFLGSAERIRERLGLTSVEFVHADVAALETLAPVDVVANVGGLYHVADPRAVLAASCRVAHRYLIVQSVVSLANDDPGYFEAPAPGWTWGCRMSRASFDAMVRALGRRVIDRHFNELAGNQRPEDRGSVYYLIDAAG